MTYLVAQLASERRTSQQRADVSYVGARAKDERNFENRGLEEGARAQRDLASGSRLDEADLCESVAQTSDGGEYRGRQPH